MVCFDGFFSATKLPSSMRGYAGVNAYQFIYLISIASVVFVNQIEWVPAEKNCLIEDFGLSVGSEGLVHKVADVELYRRSESLFFHPLATVASEGNVFSADSFEFVHDFSAMKVGLSAVGENANRSRVRTE